MREAIKISKILTKIAPFFPVKSEERSRALLMFGYLFLIISILLIVKPIRNSLFLTRFGAIQLPYVYLLVALIAGIFSVWYARLLRRFPLPGVIRTTLRVTIGSLFIFWLLLEKGYQPAWFIYGFYIWVAIYAGIATSQFWLLANHVFNAREARRLFSFIGAGGILGGIGGGYLTNYLAPVVGTHALLLLCIGFALLCILILNKVWKLRLTKSPTGSTGREIRGFGKSEKPTLFRILKNSPYLRSIAAIVAITVIVANLVDYQFNSLAETSIKNPDQLTAFFGFWLSNLSIFSLLFQLFLTGKILQSGGIKISLFFLPIGILIGALAVLLSPILWAAVFLKVSEGGLKQSVQKSAMELLAIPVPPAIKQPAKSFIDVFVDNLATGIGGLLLIVTITIMRLSVSQLSLVIIGFVLLWVLLIGKTHRGYVQAFREAITQRSVDISQLTLEVQDASLLENFLPYLNTTQKRQLLYLLHLLEHVEDDRLIPYLTSLIRHPAPEIRQQVLRMARNYDSLDFRQEAVRFLSETELPLRAEAIRYLYHRSSPEEREALMQRFLFDRDYNLRAAALQCAVQENATRFPDAPQIHLTETVREMLSRVAKVENREEQEFIKINVAVAIGEANREALYPFLEDLLEDESLTVRRTAIQSAGKVRDFRFFPRLLSFLSNHSLRRFAREAIANWGEPILPPLLRKFSDPDTERVLRREILKILALIDSQSAADALFLLLDESFPAMQFQILKALNKIRRDFPHLRIKEKLVTPQIFKEMEFFEELLTIRRECRSWQGSVSADSTHQTETEDFREARNLLLRALWEKSEQSLERLFRLLGLKFSQGDMFNAYRSIICKNEHIRASALEFLDNLLPDSLEKKLLPLIETYFQSGEDGKSAPSVVESSPAGKPFEACLTRLLHHSDPWLLSCTLFLIGLMPEHKLYPKIEDFRSYPHPVVSETAESVLRKFPKR